MVETAIGLDDHHAGGRRQAADEGEQRQRRLRRAPSGSDSTKVSASIRPGPKMQQAAEGDRQHEEVDQQQVEREQPRRRGAECRSSTHLDDHHLELARQEQRPTSIGSRVSANHCA